MITVKATREGLVGGTTASGYVIDRTVPFVALPSAKALGKFVRVVNPANGRQVLAVVLDVGPWNIADDAYVFQPATQPGSQPHDPSPVRPLAEQGVSVSQQGTNRAGIDLGEAVYHALGMTGNDFVAWEFLA